MAQGIRETDRFVLFWGGWPSQWHKARFVVNGVEYNCCEQYMMAEKAAVFGDEDARAQILATRDPRKQKAFGRKVRGFDENVWNSVCRGIVYVGNLARFSQDGTMRKALLATSTKTIVEASPMDRIWGIGIAQDDERALDPAKWQGTNWLGVALMQVRDTLRGSRAELEDEELARQLDRRSSVGIAISRTVRQSEIG
jgi:ribA/ribD-fused uncharacterized protein